MIEFGRNSMMTKPLLAVAAVTLCARLSTLPVHADFMDGNTLAGLCAADGGFESGGCVGFIVGVADAFDHSHWSNTGGIDGGEYCIPDSTTREQIVGLVVKSLDENPDQLGNLALHVVSNAFIDAFDCNADLKYP